MGRHCMIFEVTLDTSMYLGSVTAIAIFLSCFVDGDLNFIVYDGKEHNRYGVLIEVTDGEGSFVCRGDLNHYDNFPNYVCRRLGFRKAIVSENHSESSLSRIDDEKVLANANIAE